jgi:hypothetical protein
MLKHSSKSVASSKAHCLMDRGCPPYSQAPAMDGSAEGRTPLGERLPRSRCGLPAFESRLTVASWVRDEITGPPPLNPRPTNHFRSLKRNASSAMSNRNVR